ncbi:MAG TPA: glycosyltransferase, partial [Steroidobacteraceae bacterium]|nr:glycosyltransferase [Steroidobacteraceae bacterium]
MLAVLSGLDPRIGGPPSSARDIWTAAVGAGIQVSGAVCVGSPPLEGEIAATKAMERAGVAIVALPFTRHYGRLAKRWAISVPLVSWLLRSIKKFDVVQVHSGWVFSTIAGIVVAKAFRKPTVLIPHESLTRFDINNGPMAKRLTKRVIKFVLLRLSDKIVFSSWLERDDSVTERFRSKAAVIYHPVADEHTSTV